MSLPTPETHFQHVTPESTVESPPASVRIQPLTETDAKGNTKRVSWAVVGDGQVYAFPAGTTRIAVVDWLMRHRYRLTKRGEWRRA